MTAPGGPVEAILFDGASARRQPVRIAPGADRLSLHILREDAPPLVWRFDRIRAITDQSDSSRLTLTVLGASDDESPHETARLVVTDREAVAWLRRTRPDLLRRDVKPGIGRKLALWAGGAAAAVALMLAVILPGLANLLARKLPIESEVAFGKAVMTQVEWMFGDESGAIPVCTGPEGVAALGRMRDRLVGGLELGYEIDLRVFDHDMVNAFALPGGQIVIMRGLLDEAESADEVAGVLAHELGHVVARDPTRLALRAAGSAGILSLLLGDVTGGAFVSLASEHLLQSSYTRDAEAGADAFAFMLLNGAAVSSEGLAGFFDRIAGMTDAMPELLSSHPLSAGRAEAARANAAAQNGTTPVLTDADWQALRGICAS